jgi:NAD-dependent SIR2 family protein deacetylase
MPRAVDGERCALRCCLLGGGAIRKGDAAARVTTPAKQLRRLSHAAAGACAVGWEAAAPRTHFHLACWEAVASAATAPRFRVAFAKRARGPRGAALPPAEKPADEAATVTLSDAERALVDDVSDTCERFDAEATAREQARALAALLRASKHAVAFTGAGVSVSAGIPDYRGTAGVDTLAAHGAEAAASPPAEDSAGGVDAVDGEFTEAIAASASYLRLRPTACHLALVSLLRAGRLHFVVTQNCDDLHGRAGTPRAQLAELHGNVFVEYCERCTAEYRRPYCVDLFSTDCTREPWFQRCAACRHGHYTGRTCERRGCGGKLRDTIINFGDDLHESVLGGLPAAERECAAADVIVAAGCSMTVTPACDLPRLRKPGAALVLVNLQGTPADKDAQIRVFYPCDDFFRMVIEELGMGGDAAL